MNIDKKICKRCTEEFVEKENFNWSCRTHPSRWGEVMWWCCGNVKYDSPGCRLKKHESKEDEDE